MFKMFLKCLNFCTDIFIKKKTGLIRKLRLTSKLMSSTGKQIITISILPNVSRSKGNQIMKFSQLIEYNMLNTPLKKSQTKSGRETSLKPF